MWSLFPAVFSLAWPTMLEQLLQTAVQYIDTAMVGSLGTEATAAVGATTTVNWLVGSTISAIGVGLLAFISQAMGNEDVEKSRKASGQAFLITVIIGLFFTAITLGFSGIIPILMQVDNDIQEISSQYFFIIYTPMLARTATIIFGTVLRAVGDTKTPMKIGVCVNIINVILNFLLIYSVRTVKVFGYKIIIPGAGLGVIGAAIASAVAFTTGGVIMTICLWKHPVVSPKSQRLLPDFSILRPCIKVAFPNALQRFGTSMGYVVFASMINSLGDASTAAHTIANTVESAFYIPGYGMQTAAATLTGNAYGKQDINKIKELAKVNVLIEVFLMILSGLLLFIYAPDMMRLFSKDSRVIGLGAVVLRMVALSEPFYGISIVLEGMLQGMGKTVYPFLCNIAGMWGIRIIGTFFCIYFLNMGLVSAWACMILHNLLLFLMFIIYFSKFKMFRMTCF
ncbi:MAG: MATE family efflux transporter [Lachnospiraceae bacterium]|nr:MATE family efflux transporter [Lachnospiraceae bacterium]